jgi:hypothetical protein
MLKFADLSMAQKKCVVALIEAQPALKKDGKISLKEVVSITQDLAAKRDSGAPKIGYPNWLFKANKVERGLYQLPVPTAAELSQYAKDVANKPASSKIVKNKKVAKVVVAKTKSKTAATTDLEDSTRLEKIINESVEVDQDVEDFNQILRENGIEV